MGEDQSLDPTRWTNYIEDFGWNRLGFHPSEMMDVTEDRKVWWLNLELLSRNLNEKAGNEKSRRTESTQISNEIYKTNLCYCKISLQVLRDCKLITRWME